MVWTIRFSGGASRELDKLSRQDQQEIRNYLRKRISVAINPQDYGKPLRGNLSGLWRYRVGKYRLICKIEKQIMLILVIKIGKRDKVYD